MKKFIALVLMLMFVGLHVNAATLATAVSKYKNHNYVGCMADLDEVVYSMIKNKSDANTIIKLAAIVKKYDIKKIKAGDIEELANAVSDLHKEAGINKSDLDKWAYIFYYYALSMHQVGLKKESVQEMYAGAFLFSPKTKIGEYSYMAYECLQDPKKCKANDTDLFIRSGKQVSDDIVKDQLRNNLKKHQNNINSGKGLSYETETQNEKLAFLNKSSSTEIQPQKMTQENAQPTDEEIGKAIRTLQKAGINPNTYMTNSTYNEYAQLNALLNGGNNQYQNDYSMMMLNNGQKISPEVMQTMMRQQMMSGFGNY